MFKTVIGLIILSLFYIIFLTLFIKNVRRTRERVSSDYRIVFDSMGIGALVASIITVIFTFLYFRITDPRTAVVIQLTLAAVFGLVGGNAVGIFLGMIAGHIIKTYRKRNK